MVRDEETKFTPRETTKCREAPCRGVTNWQCVREKNILIVLISHSDVIVLCLNTNQMLMIIVIRFRTEVSRRIIFPRGVYFPIQFVAWLSLRMLSQETCVIIATCSNLGKSVHKDYLFPS